MKIHIDEIIFLFKSANEFIFIENISFDIGSNNNNMQKCTNALHNALKLSFVLFLFFNAEEIVMKNYNKFRVLVRTFCNRFHILHKRVSDTMK